MRPVKFSLVSENMPVWLLAMEKDYCTLLHVVGHYSPGVFLKAMREKNIDPHLVNIAVARLGLGLVRYLGAEPPSHETVLLVSGSLDFLKRTQEQWPRHRSLFLLDQPSRSKIKSSVSMKWSRLRHQTFGGATNYVALLGTMNLAIQPQRTTLTRTVGHILDHGIRPQTLPTGYNSEEALGLGNRINPGQLDQVVAYRSAYSRTGWGLRQLTPDELGIAFGLPSWLRTNDLLATHFPFVPVQIMDGCLKALCGTSANVTHQLPTPKPRSLDRGSGKTWLPKLQRFLSHDWINVDYVTSKAAKSDGAEVPTALWDQRILLPLPWAKNVLTFLPTRLLGRLQRKLYYEVRTYLRETYGEHWGYLLHQDRVCRHQVVLEDRKRLQRGEMKEGEGEEERNREEGRKQKRKRKGVNIKLASLKLTEELVRDTEAGTDVLYKLCNSTWWTWKTGSTLIFWRWPEGEQRLAARDGMKAWVQGPLPHFKRRARPPKQDKFDLILPKIKMALDKGYVTMFIDKELMTPWEGDTNSFVESLMEYFDVPKADDIRLVYNGTGCGLNVRVWAPKFWLPVPKSATNLLNFDYCSVDIDLGDFFLNFPLPALFRKYSGIDLGPFKSALGCADLSNQQFETRWERCWMGFRPSPYYALRFYYWAEEFARENPRQISNPLRWEEVRLNLPGNPAYDPTLPRVMKWDKGVDNIAGDIIGFVDDLRSPGRAEEESWQISRQVASRLQYLGI
jgi:hypothetical protein